MRDLVISYSLTGNNGALAARIAQELRVEHIKVIEPKPRTIRTIALDMMFNRTPKVTSQPERLDDYDRVIFLGPVWMGHVAAPLRAYLKHLRKKPRTYAFISISGGADGPNQQLASDLNKRVGREPIAIIDLHIADLFPSEPKPTRNDTSKYQLSESDVEKLSAIAVRDLRNTMIKQ